MYLKSNSASWATIPSMSISTQGVSKYPSIEFITAKYKLYLKGGNIILINFRIVKVVIVRKYLDFQAVDPMSVSSLHLSF